jgi:uncharacterized protein YjiS (DUF1127 family)
MRSRTWSESNPQPARRAVHDGAMRVFLHGLAKSFSRARQRRDLAMLSDYNLRDIGLTRTDVELELKKPFWRT